MDYTRLLGRAWQITWHWKALWILGFLVGLGTGGTAGTPSYTMDSSSFERYTYGPRLPPEILALLAAAVCLGLIIAIAVWVVSTIARGGLIAGVQQVEDEGNTGFGQAWRVGVRRFWTLFGISILAGLPTLILVFAGVGTLVFLILLTVSGFQTSDAAGLTGILTSVLCGGALCCGAILLALVLAQIRVYAERAAVLEGFGWIEAFKRGWQVLKENLGPTIVLWLIFFAIGLALASVIFGGLAIVFAPTFPVFAQPDPGAWLLVPMCFGGLLGAIVFAVISSVVETFSSAAWTLAYRELVGLASPPQEVAIEAAAAER